MSDVELFHFHGSHFNEKARWGLDWKGIAHERRALLPGPHAGTCRKLSGQSQTPILRWGDEVTPGSAAILARLEEREPSRPLMPEGADQRAEALAIQRDFDDEVGPAVRLAKFHEVMDAAYMKAVFAREAGFAMRTLYGLMFPLVHGKIRREMNIHDESAAEARERTRRAFDFVAKKAGPEGYLVGDRFSVADLACAALLMPAVDCSAWGGPAHSGAPKETAWFERWADHPGAEWVREIYRRHRQPS
ncbi:MAG: glutathione S-transferase family protein [Myxococcota bacterium]|nr:glutathione S-transferase family protein [Myxococcota bacterium]